MTPHRVLVVLGAVLAALAVALFMRPPMPSGDFAGALRAWDWWMAGGSFHHVPIAPLDDLSARPEVVLAWWSPGTYLPVALAEIAGWPLATALALWIPLGTWLGLWGWSRVWSLLGHDATTIAISLVLVALGWHVLYSFRIYQGGELSRFAVLPWLWLFVASAPAGSWRQALFLGLTVIVAGLVKLTLLISLVGLGLYLAWEAPRRPAAILRLGTAGAVACAVLVTGWLAHAASPGSGHPLPEAISTLQRLAMAPTLPAGAVFAQTSVAGLLGDTFLAGARPENNVPWLLLAIAFSALVYAAAWQAGPTDRARRALVAVGGITILALAVLLGRGAAVSFEDRHGRDVALLLIPTLVAFFRRSPRALRLLGSVGLAGATAWGVASLAFAWTRPAAPLGPRGLPLWQVPVPVAARVAGLCSDIPAGEAVVFTPHPELALHLPGARVFAPLPTLPETVPGRTARLVLVAPDGAALPAPGKFPGFTVDSWREEVVAGWTIRHASDPAGHRH